MVDFLVEKFVFLEFFVPIPKIIIQTHRSEDIGINEKQTWVRHHPDYQHLFFDNDNSRDFFVSKMPGLLSTYDKLPLPVQKADLFRYAAVFVYGGVYADVDTVCLAPLESYIDMNSNKMVVGIEMTPAIYKEDICRYTQEYCSPTQLLQWIFAAPPGHVALAKLLAKIRLLVSLVPQGALAAYSASNRFTVEMTGPMCFTSVLHEVLSESGAESVTVLPQLVWGYNPWHNTEIKFPDPSVKVRHLYHGTWKKP